jgi:tetratricopeptide (TPR) repeat protein
MAWAESISGDPATAVDLLRRIGDIGGNDLLTHDIGVARGHVLLRAGRFVESYGPLTAASAAATRAGRPDMAYTCLMNAASAAACAGEFERALEFTDRSLPLVVPHGMIRLGIYAWSAQATLLRRLGRLNEAGAAIDHAATLADRIGLSELDGLVSHDRGLLAYARGAWDMAAADLAAAIEAHAPVSLPLTRLHRADALARSGRLTEAEGELRATTMEPLKAGDFPDTLVARMARVQARIAAHRGELNLADSRLCEAERIWRNRIARPGDPGAGYVAALIDLGRPPISVFIEPERELAAVLKELGDCHADVR